MKINRIGHRWLQLFLFSLKMSIIAISFYSHNDTPSFVTWRSRLATAPDTPTCIVVHGGQFTGGVHPPNQFVPETISPLSCSPALIRDTLRIVYFFKELISFLGSLDKFHTSVFNALIQIEIQGHRVYFLRFCTKYLTWLSKYTIKLIVTMSSTNAAKRKWIGESSTIILIFVAFVEDNATTSSIRYFENHVLYFVQNRRK